MPNNIVNLFKDNKELFIARIHKALYNAYKKRFPDFNIGSLKRLATFGAYLAAFESGYGTSEQAINNHNYGGLSNGGYENGFLKFENMDDYANSFVDNMLIKFPDVPNSSSLNSYMNALFQGKYLYDPILGQERYTKKIQGVLNRVNGYINNYFPEFENEEYKKIANKELRKLGLTEKGFTFFKMSWITESNRQKHLLYAIPIGIVFSILCVLGCAFGMEFKDKQYGGEFDWLDIAATLIGGAIGLIIQILLFIWMI